MPITYTIEGYTSGGWNVTDTTTSLRKATAIAQITKGGFSPDSGTKVRIYANGACVKAWSGTTAGKWIAVTP